MSIVCPPSSPSASARPRTRARLRPRLLLWAASAVFLGAACLYSLMTLLYVSPDNPIRALYGRECEAFETMCYQKWTFFAPPPTTNGALYVTVKNSATGEIQMFELLAEIASAKRAALPFNTGEEITDYIVSGAADQVNRYVSMRQKNAKLLPEKKRKEQNLTEVSPTLDLPALRTLKAVARQVLVQRHINPDDVRVMLESRRRPMLPPNLFWKGLTTEMPDMAVWKSGWFDA